jgi:hypothetical protein
MNVTAHSIGDRPKEPVMKKILTALALVLTSGATIYAMSVDDIVELCRAGFEPDRIASIVEATGLDEPLGAQDWVTLKEQGCDEELVDALLEVLVPVDEAEEYTGESTESYSRPANSDVNVYLGAQYGYGWNDWWYGGFSMGWYDPYWSIGWTYWDPYWYSTWWGYRPYAYHYAWWGHPWYNYCQPSYYCYSCYDHNWSGSGGTYARYKSSRRGSLKSDSYSYAGSKTRTTVEAGVMSKVGAKTSFATSTGSMNGGVKTRSTSSGVYKSKSASGVTSTTYTTRKTAGGSGSGSVKSGSTTGSSAKTKPRSTTTTSPSTKGSYNPPSSGAKTKSSGGDSAPAIKSGDEGTTKTAPKSSDKAGTPSESDSPKARPKGGSQSSLNRSQNSVEYTTARQVRTSRAYPSHTRSALRSTNASRSFGPVTSRNARHRPTSNVTHARSANSSPYSGGSRGSKAPSVRSSAPAPSSSRSAGTSSFSGGKGASRPVGHSAPRRK